MQIEPAAVHGRSFAVVVAYFPKDGKEEVAVFGGIARWDGKTLWVDRQGGEKPFEVRPEWHERIRPVPDGSREDLYNAEYMVMLSMGPAPESEDPSERIDTGLKWPKDE